MRREGCRTAQGQDIADIALRRGFGEQPQASHGEERRQPASRPPSPKEQRNEHDVQHGDERGIGCGRVVQTDRLEDIP